MIRRFLSLSQTERDSIYEQESNNMAAQQHCADRFGLLSSDNTLVRPQERDRHNNVYTQRAGLAWFTLNNLKENVSHCLLIDFRGVQRKGSKIMTAKCQNEDYYLKQWSMKLISYFSFKLDWWLHHNTESHEKKNGCASFCCGAECISMMLNRMSFYVDMNQGWLHCRPPPD